jgi:hypothetical protein
LTGRTAPALALPELPVIPKPAPQDAPPDGWQSHDVGEPSVKGGQRVMAADAMDVFGAGRDVYEGNDECHFVARPVSDRFELSASATPPVDTHTYAKAGLMYRASLDASAPIVMICQFPDGTCTFAYRRQPGARITEIHMPPAGKARALRLVRNGAHFEATAFDEGGKPFATQTVDLTEVAEAKGHAGLFVLSHEAALLSKATFAKVEFR